MISIQFFASLSERLGRSSIAVEYTGDTTVNELKRCLSKHDRSLGILEEKNILVAINHSMAAPHSIVSDGDEIAFFPPVTGG